MAFLRSFFDITPPCNKVYLFAKVDKGRIYGGFTRVVLFGKQDGLYEIRETIKLHQIKEKKTMKKCTLTFLLIILITAVLTACGGSLSKPNNGTYKSDDGIMSQTWTFSGENKVTLSYGIISSDGTYAIDGDELTITSSMLGSETTSSYTITEITSNSFFIDGTKFEKQ